jgi:hypothetical protein
VAASGVDSLTIVDITNPAAPSVAGTVTDPALAGAYFLAVLGNYAYVTIYSGLTVVDITNPVAPVVAGTVTDVSLTGASGVAVSGGYAYVAASGIDSLTVVDVTNPVAPAITGTVTYASLTGATGVAFAGGFVSVAAAGANSLTVVDVNNPAAPEVVGTVASGTIPIAVPGAAMAYLSPPFMDVVDPMLLIAMLGGGDTYYWFSVAGPPPPPGTPFQPLTQGSRRMHMLIPNRWDACLDRDVKINQLAGPQRSCCHDMAYSDIENVRAPANSIPFRKVNAIPTPLAASGDVIVLDFQVPQGYDGLVSGCFNAYTGPGFQEGNGDIEWRILINKVYAVQLGRILVTLGSRAQSYPIDGGIQIQSGQRIQYIVNVPNLSGGILPLASQVVCGLEGLFYARQ